MARGKKTGSCGGALWLLLILGAIGAVIGGNENKEDTAMQTENVSGSEETEVLYESEIIFETDTNAFAIESENNKETEHEDEKYIINNLLVRYNEFAEYPIDAEFISDMEEGGRPVEKLTVTIGNGVYVLLQYNDFSNKLFIEYQDEAYDSSALFIAFRDISKALNPAIADEDIEDAWTEFESGRYSDYYGERYDLKGIISTYMKNVLNSGIVRYAIKCEYEIKSS